MFHEVKNFNNEDCLDDLVRLSECSLVSELSKILEYILYIPRTDRYPQGIELPQVSSEALGMASQ